MRALLASLASGTVTGNRFQERHISAARDDEEHTARNLR